MSGRKVELDEVTVPAPLLESSLSQKSVPVTTTPISEEANDDDHVTSDQVTTEPRRSTRVKSAPKWYGNSVLEVMLLDHDESTNYEEAMVSPDSAKWLEAMKLRWDPCMRTKYGLWLTCPMIGKPQKINGSSRGRQTLIVVLLSTKLELSQKVFDKFKVLTTMRVSHSYLCLSLFESC